MELNMINCMESELQAMARIAESNEFYQDENQLLPAYPPPIDRTKYPQELLEILGNLREIIDQLLQECQNKKSKGPRKQQRQPQLQPQFPSYSSQSIDIANLIILSPSFIESLQQSLTDLTSYHQHPLPPRVHHLIALQSLILFSCKEVPIPVAQQSKSRRRMDYSIYCLPTNLILPVENLVFIRDLDSLVQYTPLSLQECITLGEISYDFLLHLTRIGKRKKVTKALMKINETYPSRIISEVFNRFEEETKES